MTLDEYTKLRTEYWGSMKAFPGYPVGGGGVMCPKCKKGELVFPGSDATINIHSHPPTRWASCPACAYKMKVVA